VRPKETTKGNSRGHTKNRKESLSHWKKRENEKKIKKGGWESKDTYRKTFKQKTGEKKVPGVK